MNEVEQRIRKLASKYHVTVVVPDVYRGVGEIMARRNGLNYLIVNTDLKDAVNLPSSLDRSVLERSSVARRRCLMECDRLFYVTNCPSAKSFLDEIPKWSRLSNIKLTSFKAFYVKVKKETKRNSTQCESKTKRKSKK